MNVIEAITGRHSCRKFCINQKIAKESISSILESGMQAPSGKNLQPWKFTVVDNSKLISEIGALCTYR